MKISCCLLVALLWDSGAHGASFHDDFLDAVHVLKDVSNSARHSLRAVEIAATPYAARSLLDNTVQKFEIVSNALGKVDGMLSSLEKGARSIPIPGLKIVSTYVPKVHNLINAGRSAINAVVNAQKELQKVNAIPGVRNLKGQLGGLKMMLTSLLGMFKGGKRQTVSNWSPGAPLGPSISSPEYKLGTSVPVTGYGWPRSGSSTMYTPPYGGGTYNQYGGGSLPSYSPYPTVGNVNPSFGGSSLPIGSTYPAYGSSGATYGGFKPSYGTSVPSYGSIKPSYGSSSLDLGSMYPSFRSGSSSGSIDPTYGKYNGSNVNELFGVSGMVSKSNRNLLKIHKSASLASELSKALDSDNSDHTAESSKAASAMVGYHKHN